MSSNCHKVTTDHNSHTICTAQCIPTQIHVKRPNLHQYSLKTGIFCHEKATRLMSVGKCVALIVNITSAVFIVYAIIQEFFIVPLDSDLYFAHFRKISPIFVVTNCFQSDLFIIANFLKLQNKVERVQLP